MERVCDRTTKRQGRINFSSDINNLNGPSVPVKPVHRIYIIIYSSKVCTTHPRSVFGSVLKILIASSIDRIMAKAMLVATFFVALSTITLGSSITWIVLGHQYRNDPCNGLAPFPDLAVYLFVTGMLGVGSFVFYSLLLTFIVFNEPFAGLYPRYYYPSCLLWIVITVSWAILGEYRIANDQHCRYENPTLYNAAFSANVILYFGLIVTGALSAKNSTADDN